MGGAISIIAPLVITFLDPFKTVGDIAVVFTFPGLAHILCGNIIEPHLFGSAFDLHPIIVMFCLVVWSSLWGVTGAVLSVPLTCCLKLALKPNVKKHPYAMFLYYLMEFRMPDESELEEVDLGSGTPQQYSTREGSKMQAAGLAANSALVVQGGGLGLGGGAQAGSIPRDMHHAGGLLVAPPPGNRVHPDDVNRSNYDQF